MPGNCLALFAAGDDVGMGNIIRFDASEPGTVLTTNDAAVTTTGQSVKKWKPTTDSNLTQAATMLLEVIATNTASWPTYDASTKGVRFAGAQGLFTPSTLGLLGRTIYIVFTIEAANVATGAIYPGGSMVGPP